MAKLFSILFLPILLLSLLPHPLLANAVSTHGRLQVKGNKVLNQHGKPISLGGSSLFWSYAKHGSKFYNEATIDTLAKHWNISIIRLAIATKEEGGYIQNPQQQLAPNRHRRQRCCQK